MKKILITLCLLILSSTQGQAYPKNINIYDYPRDVPQKELMDKYGKKVKFKDYEGQFLIVVFWSKYCVPCLREMKSLEIFQEKTKNDGIKLIIVSNEREWDSLKEYLKILKKYKGENLEAYTDNNGELHAAFGIHTFPNTILINAKGLEIGRIRGSADWSDEDMIEDIYKIKAENNNREHVNPNIGIKKIKVEEL